MADTPLLEVQGLSTHYVSARGTRVTRAVEDVSFTLRDGDTLGIVGESGSGKSTLALSLLRLLPPAARIVAGAVRFEGETHFPDLAFNVRVLEPGQPNCLYHRESQTEAFLVLEGECTAIVEEQERPMRKGDFLYAPPGTAHVFVGAGERPCAIAMVSTRIMPETLLYPVSAVAGRRGASATEETESADEAYAGSPPPEAVRLELPW